MIERILNKQKSHLIIFFVVFLGSIFLLLGRLQMSGSAIGGDAVYYYATLRSIVIDHDLNFANEYEYFHNQRSGFTENRKIPIIPDKNPVTKKFPAKYPIGSAIFLAPPYFLTHISLIFLQKLRIGILPDGYNLIYQAFAALTSLTYAFVGLLLIYELGKKIFEPKVAFLGTLSIWLTTPLIYYATMEPLTSQPLSFFNITLFIYFWYTTRQNRKFYQWIILGLIGGLMSIVRYQDSLFLLIPIIDNFKRFYSNFLKILIFLLFAGFAITIQLAVNLYLYGSPILTGYGDAGFPYLLSPKIFYSLLSFRRGLLVWSPILVFALTGLYWFIRKARIVGFLLVLSFLLQLYAVSSWADPSQGDSFGNRILLNSNIIFALGLMQFLKETQTHQKIFLTIFAFLISLNFILAGLFIFRIIGQPY